MKSCAFFCSGKEMISANSSRLDWCICIFGGSLHYFVLAMFDCFPFCYFAIAMHQANHSLRLDLVSPSATFEQTEQTEQTEQAEQILLRLDLVSPCKVPCSRASKE